MADMDTAPWDFELRNVALRPQGSAARQGLQPAKARFRHQGVQVAALSCNQAENAASTGDWAWAGLTR
ncbi:hypothetical protein Acidovoranil_20570 [Acidovorax sp. FG27]